MTDEIDGPWELIIGAKIRCVQHDAIWIWSENLRWESDDKGPCVCMLPSPIIEGRIE